jgi:hypothetical protein
VRRTNDPALYVTVTRTLSRYFAIVGGMFGAGAVVAAVIGADRPGAEPLTRVCIPHHGR